MSKNLHDKHFHALLEEREFAIPFLQSHLPEEIKNRIDWSSLHLRRMGGKHVIGMTKASMHADIVYLVDIDNHPALLWIHIEHQSTFDPLMPLRILQYQVGELLAYAKSNKTHQLPAIISLLFHQGTRPLSEPVELSNVFKDPDLALRYLGNPILIDLPSIPDAELLAQPVIGHIELLLKKIRDPSLQDSLPVSGSGIKNLSDSLRRIVLESNVSSTLN